MAKRLTPELKDKLNRMHNQTAPILIDELGAIRKRQKALKDEEDLVKTVLETKLGEDKTIDFAKDVLSGQSYTLQVIKTVRTTFSGEKAKQFLTPEQIEQCNNTTEVTQYRTSLKDEPTSAHAVEEATV